MGDWARLLVGSIALRPYVYIFVGVHLFSASALLGWRRTAGFTLITWIVAFVAEASSIRTGIPFGWYFYIPRTADRELWIGGVPFFDSLSFSFLLVSSYGLAWLLLGRGGRFRRPNRMRHLLLATGLFVLADVIIDPVALRGERWFLGQIYGYPSPGIYFGVPIANFVGWGVVGAIATIAYHAWERGLPPLAEVRFAGRAALCPGLYFLVLAFNLTVTFAIREWALGACGLLYAVPLAVKSLTVWSDRMLPIPEGEV